ncbi:aminotransferase class I/II-fold pyridoxal phosphate-dependent enzyme [Luteipulveratus sp. YIM 133132]|uniref:pyridoxal phosphate-dependent aminotransferase n=1 Tax=Luteipulveratus flavus TaxID=3031728 RepID=UPI0023B130A6|nr:aminotransferase class I/II-fold pyridoxal phosphate-dependent enzyme [Luteipulveratus sp. YIM 133132]MDE9365299.1 aminotransferase class I/II-fold pyridoxal phosphate-dependent enzyme [Luteipulveratus sp. YIM 133132]
MRQPSRRGQVEPFHVMEVLKAGAQRQRTHGDVILMCAGQPSTPAPQVVLEAARNALTAGPLGYTETAGILPLRQAIADHHTSTYGVEVDPEQVVVTTGSSGGFTALFLAAFEPGDVVAMTRPGYPAYRNTLRALGIAPYELECGPQTRFQPTVAMLEAMPEPPAGVIIASPANPTGTIIDADELAAIARWCDEQDCLLISDEIYHGISYGRPCASAWETSTSSVVVGSVSKYFSMTGWRLGWMLLPRTLARPVELLSGNLSICPPAVAQHAALACFTPPARAELDGHVLRYAESRAHLVEALPRIGVTSYAPPDGAFYAWCDVRHLTDDSTAWCREVLARTGVAITPGVDFDPVDGRHFMRLSFAGSTAEVTEAMERLVAHVVG